MVLHKCTIKRNQESELNQAILDLENRGYKVTNRGFHEGVPHIKLKMNHGNKLGNRKESLFSPHSETTDIVKEFYWAELERSEQAFKDWLKRMEGVK